MNNKSLARLREELPILPHIKVELYSGITLGFYLPFMVASRDQYSTYLPNRGLLCNFLDDNFLIPLAIESTEMVYSASEMTNSLGNLQNKIRLKNLIESYIVILLIAAAIVAFISVANSDKFVLKTAHEIRVGGHNDAILEFVEEYSESASFETSAKL